MTDDERSAQIDEMLDDVVADMVVKGLVSDEIAGFRTLITAGLFALPERLCADHLRETLQRYQAWICHDLERITPN